MWPQGSIYVTRPTMFDYIAVPAETRKRISDVFQMLAENKVCWRRCEWAAALLCCSPLLCSALLPSLFSVCLTSHRVAPVSLQIHLRIAKTFPLQQARDAQAYLVGR